ncbi:hypothetical protein T01_2171 [Trichinella spiralis]|uniref:Uncharacterized protein n=1 Tax=Trichinella spiralis TaxID=6334 RepID=A0A0V1AK59_TRISP|nr:hypothetical protein T01_2171 [Trichinella spiralis]
MEILYCAIFRWIWSTRDKFSPPFLTGRSTRYLILP